MTTSKTTNCPLLVLAHHAWDVQSPSAILEDSNLSSGMNQYRLYLAQRDKRTLTLLLNLSLKQFTFVRLGDEAFSQAAGDLGPYQCENHLFMDSLIFFFHVNCIHCS